MGAISDKHRQVIAEHGELRPDPRDARIAKLEAEIAALQRRTDKVERDVGAARSAGR